MRKLAPMFILGSVMAFAAGNVLANDSMATDKNGQPTVSANTAKQNKLSYSDKSNASPGTNAQLKSRKANGMAAADPNATPMGEPRTAVAGATDEDHKDLAKKSDKPAKKKVVKKKVASNAKHHDVRKDTAKANIDKNPPLSATEAERANSTTGKSAGQ